MKVVLERSESALELDITSDSLVEHTRGGTEVEGSTSRVYVASFTQIRQVFDFISVKNNNNYQSALAYYVQYNLGFK